MYDLTASDIATTLIKSLSAKKSKIDFSNDFSVILLKTKPSRKAINAVAIKKIVAIFFRSLIIRTPTTKASTILNKVRAKNILSFLILNLISLFLAYVNKTRWNVQR